LRLRDSSLRNLNTVADDAVSHIMSRMHLLFRSTVLSFALLTLTTRALAQKADLMQIDTTLCEMRHDPLGIDSPKPRLSWKLSATGHDAKQSAYQVLVASRPELLTEGKADLWDSGRVASDQSLHVEYAGKPLTSSQQVFWTARVWDARTDKPSEWAKPATWTMALLSPVDWHARWMGFAPPAPPSPMAGAKWVWYAEPSWDKAHPVDAPPGGRLLWRSFDLPAGAPVRAARLMISVDNESTITLNDRPVGVTTDWRSVGEFDVAPLLKVGGTNVLRVLATNGANKPNAAGVLASLTIERGDGMTQRITTDEQWQASVADDAKSSTTKSTRTTSSASAPSSAPVASPVRVLGDWGMGPWNRLAETPPVLPIARRGFALDKPVRRAVVHVTGLGHYRLYVNGEPARQTVLDPPWSKYEKTIFYDTIDVTPLVRRGENAFGIELGKGYYNTLGDRRIHAGVFDRPLAAIVQAHIEFEDGSTQEIVSDESWRWTQGPYTHNSIIGGCDYDARLLPDGWASPGFDDHEWKPARLIDPPTPGKVVASSSPPIKTFQEFAPTHIDEPEPGHFVYDFGQNASATVRLTVRGGKPGQTLRLTYAEQRHGASPHKNDGRGLVDQSGIRSPNYIEYTCRGGGEESWFYDEFYSGFQYIEITGAVPDGKPNPKGLPVVAEVKSVHVHADAPPVGALVTSNEMYGRIDRMVDWAVRSNLMHVLTDCPHREKLGWLEVPHLMWPGLAMKYDLAGFGPKVCRDIRDTQAPDGMIPTVAPSYDPKGYHFGGFNNPFGYTPEWGAAGVLIPWYVYAYYGDERCLADNYDCMRKYVDFMRGTCKEGELVPKGGLGDWYDYGHGKALGPSQFTPVELTAMAIFHDCARRVADAAHVLKRGDDEQKYRDLAARIAADFNRRYFNADTGEYKNNGSCQTANAMALVCGITPAADARRVTDAIVADLEKRGYQQTSGDVGFHYLVRALADNGRSDAIFKILARSDLGSYAYLVNNGWTSLPEAWDADHNSSMNHCMLGHIEEWFAQDLGGIKPIDGVPAFKRFRVCPVVGEGVTSAGYSFDSPYGRIVTAWRVEGDQFHLDVTVPPNTSADVWLPNTTTAEHVGSGTHHFDGPRAAVQPRKP
jgi:alpha-L-rhamnosidase